MTDCCCGNPEGTNKECERCRLIAEIAFLKRCLKRLTDMGFPVARTMALELRQTGIVPRDDRCTTCGMGLDDDGTCEPCVSPEDQRKNDAMERGDYERDRAKDERAERKHGT